MKHNQVHQTDLPENGCPLNTLFISGFVHPLAPNMRPVERGNPENPKILLHK